MKKVLIPVFAALLLVSCGSGTDKITAQSDEAQSAFDADAELSPELRKELKDIAAQQRKEEELRLSKQTSLEFNKMKHDFGDVEPDSDNITEFIVTNTGNKPLIIEDVSASCGCTMPKKPEAPIAPGKSDVIEVKFHPKPGQVNEIIKTVTVVANTEQKVHKVDIRAFVKQ